MRLPITATTPLLNLLGTLSGKDRNLLRRHHKMHYVDCPGIPTRMPPHEW